MHLHRVCLTAVALALTGLVAHAQDDGVIWLEAESFAAVEGEVMVLDHAAPDYGQMAHAGASAEAFFALRPDRAPDPARDHHQ